MVVYTKCRVDRVEIQTVADARAASIRVTHPLYRIRHRRTEHRWNWTQGTIEGTRFELFTFLSSFSICCTLSSLLVNMAVTQEERPMLPILCLPPEIRHEIYSYLLPAEPLSYPIPTLNIVAVSHRPPKPALLVVNSQLTKDVQDYYNAVATWKITISHAFNFFRIDPTFSNLAGSRYLKTFQRLEIRFFFDGSLIKDYPSFGTNDFCNEMKRRATRACEVLSSAPNLEHITVSWIDTTTSGTLEEKVQVLSPLSLFKSDVDITLGQIDYLAAPDRDFEGTMRRHLTMLHKNAVSP